MGKSCSFVSKFHFRNCWTDFREIYYRFRNCDMIQRATCSTVRFLWELCIWTESVYRKYTTATWHTRQYCSTLQLPCCHVMSHVASFWCRPCLICISNLMLLIIRITHCMFDFHFRYFLHVVNLRRSKQNNTFSSKLNFWKTYFSEFWSSGYSIE
jgi:hypothetical protein